MKLILASASPRRRELLKRLRIPFRFRPSHVSERSTQKSARHLVTDLALRKAKAVAGQMRFVLPRRLGEVALFDDVPESDVTAVLSGKC